MQVVRSTGVPYYVRDLVPGRAEGTRVAGESPGRWTGGGSSVLGLRGVVGAGDFTDLFAGRDPLGDRPLRAPGGARSVAGVDVVLCAPKSVSLLHLLGPGELARAAGEAHGCAVADAVVTLERSGLGVRRTRGGVTRHLAATGMVAAAFDHRTSRALDPHLHTHLVVANVAQGVDGVWSAVDTRRLFLARRTVGAVYDASLRRQLTERLGVAWERAAGTRWDIAGVDPVLLRIFSQRAASIDELAHRRGDRARTPGGRRAVFHAERPDKDAGPTVEGLRADWRRRAADQDRDPADLVRVVGRARTAEVGPGVDRALLSAHLAAAGRRRPMLGRGDLAVAVADAAPGGLRGDELESAVDGLARAAGPVDGVSTGRTGGGPVPPVSRWTVVALGRAVAAPGWCPDGGSPDGYAPPARDLPAGAPADRRTHDRHWVAELDRGGRGHERA
jgi:conjugative relaxase-like TrwC/TraI family protein